MLKPTNVTESHPGLSILDELKAQYDVSSVPYFSTGLIEDFDVVIVIDAPVLKNTMLRDIDRHISSGKGALVLIDPFQRMNSANAKLTIKKSESGDINSILDLLRVYGLDIDGDVIVGDLENSATVESTVGNSFNYPYWLRIREEGISRASTLTGRLQELLFAEAGYFEVNEGQSDIEPLITTGVATANIDRKELNKASPKELSSSFSPVEKGQKRLQFGLVDWLGLLSRRCRPQMKCPEHLL